MMRSPECLGGRLSSWWKMRASLGSKITRYWRRGWRSIWIVGMLRSRLRYLSSTKNLWTVLGTSLTRRSSGMPITLTYTLLKRLGGRIQYLRRKNGFRSRRMSMRRRNTQSLIKMEKSRASFTPRRSLILSSHHCAHTFPRTNS